MASLVLHTGCDRFHPAHPTDDPFRCVNGDWQEARFDPRRFIAHAGGEIGGHRYTNSLEAMDHSYDRGFRLFEIDLNKTLDGHLVGVHDWDTWREAAASSIEWPTLQQFKDARLHGQYQTMDLTDLDRWFSERPDAYLVTDKTRDFEALIAGFSHRSRLIVEVFSVDEYQQAVDAGIRFPMLSLYSAIYGDGEERVMQFLEQNPVKFIAVLGKRMYEFPDMLGDLREGATCVYAFTSNDERFISERIGVTIYGVYTDAWDVLTGKCSSAKCDSY